jgi:hypothetical protein
MVFYVNILGTDRAEKSVGTSSFGRFTMVVYSGPMDFRSLLETHVTTKTKIEADTYY